MYNKEEDKNKNLVVLYKALLSEGIVEDAYLRELAFVLFSDSVDELIESIKGSG